MATQNSEKKKPFNRNEEETMSRPVHVVNPNADVIDKKEALAVNVAAAKGLMSVLKTNLGPRGTMKMSSFLFLD